MRFSKYTFLACVAAACLVATVVVEAQASWLARLMPGRFASTVAPTHVNIDGTGFVIQAYIAHDTDRQILHYVPGQLRPDVEVLKGQTTGVHVAVSEPRNGATQTIRLSILSVQVLRNGRELFSSNVVNGILGSGPLRATASGTYVGYGPAVPVNADYTMVITIQSESGPVRVHLKAPVLPSSTVRLFYGYPAGGEA